MRNRRTFGRWLVLGAASVSALALSFALVIGSRDDVAEAVCGGNPCMTVDADAATGGIQADIVIATGASFDIAIEGSAIPASTLEGYQWQIQFEAAVLNFVSATENTAGTGAVLCAPVANNAGAPVGKEWWGQGAGCLAIGSLSGPAVRLTTVTLQCDPSAPAGTTSELHLVTGGDGASGEDPTFGSIYLGPGGTFFPTDLTDASIQCGAGAPIPTSTPTATATATATVPLANTPTPGPSSTPLPPQFTRTPTATSTGTAAAATATAVAGTPGVPGVSPTAPGGTAGGGGSGPIRLPDTGNGSDSGKNGAVQSVAIVLAFGIVVGTGALKLSREVRRVSK